MKEAEFAKIVEQTKGYVLKAIEKHLFAEFAAYIDDVVQETYYRAYKSLSDGKFRKEAGISTYLYVIARNEALRMNSKQMKHARKKSLLHENIEQQAAGHEDALMVRELAFLLPRRFKEVFELTALGLSESETAERLRISAGTVKSRLFRARTLIRKKTGGAK